MIMRDPVQIGKGGQLIRRDTQPLVDGLIKFLP